MQSHMYFAVISSLCFSGAVVWIYSQIRGDGPWLAQGIRFGLAVWAVADVPLYLTNYTIEPWPGVFVAKILVWELFAAVVLGTLTAALAKGDFSAGTNRPVQRRHDTEATLQRRKA
jgi:hypothetical protein